MAFQAPRIVGQGQIQQPHLVDPLGDIADRVTDSIENAHARMTKDKLRQLSLDDGRSMSRFISRKIEAIWKRKHGKTTKKI